MPDVPQHVIAEQYQLKATFFANSLDRRGYIGLFEYVADNLSNLDSSLKWEKSDEFGIRPEIKSAIEDKGWNIGQHLCHPNLIIANSRYLIYFRCIAALSQKGLKTLSGVSSVDKLEAGKGICNPQQAKSLAIAINENLNAIYAVALPDSEKLKGLMYATAGTTVDGSWRNQIGVEGERIIRTLFLKELLSHHEIAKVMSRSGLEYDAKDIDADWLDEKTAEISSCITSNGAVIQFASEPDIKLIDQNAKTVGGVEIKAGIDPAGALERLGAMMKSFENIRSESSEAETILVASCITNEVETRLRSMKGVRTFIMTDVIQNKKGIGTRLMNIMRASIGLTKTYQ